MRIIVWGINYSPEQTGIAPFNTGLCDYLKKRGHEVEMVTAFPYYPFWKKNEGDKGKLFRTDDGEGVPVHRCWHYVPPRVTTVRRVWHELSFGILSLFRVLSLKSPDIYVVVSPPLILGPLASLVGAIKRRPYIFHVQDLQPDAAVGLGMVKVGAFTRLLYRIEGWSYRHAAAVSGISDGMMKAFTRKGVSVAKQWLSPNWIRGERHSARSPEEDPAVTATGARFRVKYNIPHDTFLAAYSGNLGRKQGLESLVEAAGLLSARSDGAEGADRPDLPGGRRELLILIVGDGVMRQALEDQLSQLRQRHIRMLPLLNEADYEGLLAASDISLILQAPGTGQYFFPSKLLSVLAMGVPVLSVADEDSELAKAVAEGGFGVNILPSNPAALVATLRSLAADPDRLKALRQNTRWVERFSAPNVLGAFERNLLKIAGSARNPPSKT